MDSLLTIIIIISLVVAIIFTVKTIKAYKDTKKTQLKYTIISFAVTILALIGLGMTGESSDGSNSKTFDFTVDDYQATLIIVVDAFKGTSFINLGGLEVEDANTHTFKLMDGIKLVIRLNDEERIEDVNILATASAFSVHNKEVRIAFQSLIKSIDPSLNTPQQLTIMDKLHLNWKGNMLDNTSTYDFNGITYSYIGNPDDQLLMLQARPK